MALPNISDFDLLEIIGTGSYSTVHRAKKKVKSMEMLYNCVDAIVIVLCLLFCRTQSNSSP